MTFDFIFVLFATFCLSFAWTRYYIHNNLICLFLSVCIVILCFLGIKTLFFDKKHKKIVKKQEKNQIDRLADYLSFLPEKQLSTLFLKLPQIADKQPKAHKNIITFCENQQTKKLVLAFESATFCKKDFCKIIKQHHADQLTIFATGFEKDLIQTAQKAPCKTKFIDKTQTFFMLKNADLLPNLPKEKNKITSNFWYVVFNKSRSKYYLWSSVFLILTSFLTFFPTYYLISGTILFFVSIYARFNEKFNLKNEEEI